MPETILLKNPRVLEVVEEELQHGAGRNATEAAENLVFAGAELRKLRRASKPTAAAPAETRSRKKAAV